MREAPAISDVLIRQAGPSDVEAIAEAHRDSIQTIGPDFYARTDVDAWQEGLSGDVYLRAMDRGEVFFIASGHVGGTDVVLGFSSDYVIEGGTHGTSVYVRGMAARRGIGTALLRRAEAHGAARGAMRVEIEASLAGVEFYKANRYIEVRTVDTRLRSGRTIACVVMRKDLARTNPEIV
jgi:putative acetyltransferase